MICNRINTFDNEMVVCHNYFRRQVTDHRIRPIHVPHRFVAEFEICVNACAINLWERVHK